MGSTKAVAWSRGAGRTTGGVGAGDWFGGRREYFVRQVLSDSLHLITWFQQLYNRYIEGCLHEKVAEGSGPEQERHAVQTELLQQFTVMVGTERDTGPLWQLKDLCHQIWPHAQEEEHFHGVLFDWLTGSLFHECMKLKENLYLLSNYGARTATVDTLVEQMGLRQQNRAGLSSVEDVRMLIGQITGDVSRQMERVGFLFGQVNYLLRLMLPALIDNRLVVRLLAEKEEVLMELWGESLDDLFAGLFTGGAAAGFCLAGENFFRGQWYEQALRLYKRALACDRCCHEAFVRVAQLHAIIGKQQAHNP